MNTNNSVSRRIRKWYCRFEYFKRHRICSNELTRIRSKLGYDTFDWIYRNKRKEELNVRSRASVVWGVAE